jgi:hypothetical protein
MHVSHLILVTVGTVAAAEGPYTGCRAAVNALVVAGLSIAVCKLAAEIVADGATYISMMMMFSYYR